MISDDLFYHLPRGCVSPTAHIKQLPWERGQLHLPGDLRAIVFHITKTICRSLVTIDRKSLPLLAA
jgi:hypothetical protein